MAFTLETPTETVTLPSGLVATVREMLGADENILVDRRLLKEGKQISRFLANVVQKIGEEKPTEKDIRNLYIADRRALLLAVRNLSFGAEIVSEQMCSNCELVNEITLDLEQDIEYVPANENLEEDIKLPSSKYIVTVGPIKGTHEERIAKMGDSDEKITDIMLMYLRKVVSPTGEQLSDAVYRDFLKAIPARDSAAVRKAMEDIEFGPEVQKEFTCPNCGNRQRLDVTQFPEFYLPKN